MANELNDPPTTYRPGSAPVTPYQLAAQEWDMRIGSARRQAENWRIIALSLCALSLLLAGGLIYQSAKATVSPYVVRVNNDGEAQAIAPAGRANYQPGTREIQYFLSQFVTWVRSVPLDPVVAKNQWLSAYNFLRPRSAVALNAIDQREQPLAKVGVETVTVRIKSVVQLSSKTYQIRWEETTISREGVPTETRGMTGIFTTEITPPTDEKKLRDNPLGLYIEQFSWSRDV